MARLSLKPNPTFKARVMVPIPGGKPEPIEFTFRNRDRDALAAWLEALEGKPTEEAVMEMASGWDLEDAFDIDNVRLLLRGYIGSWSAIYDKYLDELVKAREKN